MIIEEHKNGEATVRIHDDSLTGKEESFIIIEKTRDSLLRNAVKPCQWPLENRKAGEWWSDMEEVYHLD